MRSYTPHVKRCPDCGGNMEIATNLMGRYIRCTKCDHENNVEWYCGGFKRKERS